jgi:hypothetical protein
MRRWNDNIKKQLTILGKEVGERGIDLSFWLESAESFCENGNEPSGSIRGKALA